MRKRWNFKCDYEGFGDAVVVSWIAEGANRAGYDVRFCSGGRHDETFKLLGQRLTDEKYGIAFEHSHRWKTVAERLMGVEVDPWHRIANVFLPWKTEPARPTVQLHDEETEWAWNIVNRKGAPDGPVVVLFPSAVYNYRVWPTAYWLRLAWALHDDGCNVISLDSRKEPMEHHPYYIWGHSWRQIAALVRMADLVVGNESGPMHLVGTMNQRGLCLCGPSPVKTILGMYPSVQPLRVSPEVVPCVGCNWARPEWSVACVKGGCEALMMLRWQDVYRAASDALLPLTVDRKAIEQMQGAD